MQTLADCSNYGSIEQYRSFPRLQLFELIVHRDLKYLDFSQNKEWPDSDQMQDVSRTLWKIIGDKCHRLEKFIVPKELTYSSTMNKIFINGGQNLTHLTLKRNVPNNLFLSVIGQNCANIKELDVAGADIVSGECKWPLKVTFSQVITLQFCYLKVQVRQFPLSVMSYWGNYKPSSSSAANISMTQYLHLKKIRAI